MRIIRKYNNSNSEQFDILLENHSIANPSQRQYANGESLPRENLPGRKALSLITKRTHANHLNAPREPGWAGVCARKLRAARNPTQLTHAN